MRPSQLLAVLEREYLSAREGSHTPVMLWGPPGVGKSQIVAQVAARHGSTGILFLDEITSAAPSVSAVAWVPMRCRRGGRSSPPGTVRATAA